MGDNLADLADRWIAFIRRRHPEVGDLRDVPASEIGQFDEALQSLLELVLNDQTKAFQVIEEILGKTADPWILANLGAGPLEDLLSTGDEAAITWISSLAGKYGNTREALSNVWVDGFPLRSREAIQKIVSR